MFTKISNSRDGFSNALIQEWEKSDGVDFAVALSRITGWLLNIDWWSPYKDAPQEAMRPLRVYVGNGSDLIFDFLGKKSINPFSEYIIKPIVEKRAYADGGIVLTRYYEESKLARLPLRKRPDEISIRKATEAISKNKGFLAIIPPRSKPCLPAAMAARYAFGWCAVYADALQDVYKVPATAIMVNRYSDLFYNSHIGYCHSIIQHQDGSVEDSWGKQELNEVLNRFNVVDYTLDVDRHKIVSNNLQNNSPEKYEAAFKEAVLLIKEFCV